jgi:hypothetical protein
MNSEFVPRDQALHNIRFRTLLARLCGTNFLNGFVLKSSFVKEELGAWHAIAVRRVVTDTTRQYPFRLRTDNEGLFVRDLDSALRVMGAIISAIC